MKDNTSMTGKLPSSSLPVIIAECGNNHGGVFTTAIELLEEAKTSGADLVKFQAGTAEGFTRENILIPFYRTLELGLENYKKLIQIGKEIGIPVFFSIWGEGFEELRELQQYHKIAARQYSAENLKKYDSKNTFVSIPFGIGYLAFGHFKSTIFHVVPEYPTYNPQLDRIKLLKQVFQSVGYSDHTVGISTCITAVKDFGAVAIEKHFTLPELKKESKFRDHIHSATPKEFRIMVDILKGG